VMSSYLNSIIALIINYRKLKKLILEVTGVGDSQGFLNDITESAEGDSDDESSIKPYREVAPNEKLSMFVEEVTSSSVVLSWCDVKPMTLSPLLDSPTSTPIVVGGGVSPSMTSTLAETSAEAKNSSLPTYELQVSVNRLDGLGDWTTVNEINEVEPGTETEFTVDGLEADTAYRFVLILTL
jgi:hypothetical protein